SCSLASRSHSTTRMNSVQIGPRSPRMAAQSMTSLTVKERSPCEKITRLSRVTGGLTDIIVPGFTGLGSCACFREAREVSARAMVINPMVCTKVHPPLVSNLGQQRQRLLAASHVPEGITHALPSAHFPVNVF